MWQVLRGCLHRLKLLTYRGRIERVLARVGGGGVRSDGLLLNRVYNRLEIQWRARDIHPWDRSLPLEERRATFVEQTLADTEAAISELFESFPQVDVIDLVVLGPASQSPIMAGTVHRSVLSGARRFSSVRMRLSELGVDYRLTGSSFSEIELSPAAK
jgi:hypothetical protein